MSITKTLLKAKLPNPARYIRPTDLLLLADIGLFVALIEFQILIPDWAWIFFAALSLFVFYGPYDIDAMYGHHKKKQATFMDAALAVERMLMGQGYQDRANAKIRELGKKKDENDQ